MNIIDRIFRRKPRESRQQLLNELRGWRYFLTTTRDPIERIVIQNWIRDLEEKLREMNYE